MPKYLCARRQIVNPVGQFPSEYLIGLFIKVMLSQSNKIVQHVGGGSSIAAASDG
jgi:hypothetical protein